MTTIKTINNLLSLFKEDDIVDVGEWGGLKFIEVIMEKPLEEPINSQLEKLGWFFDENSYVYYLK